MTTLCATALVLYVHSAQLDDELWCALLHARDAKTCTCARYSPLWASDAWRIGLTGPALERRRARGPFHAMNRTTAFHLATCGCAASLLRVACRPL